MATEIDPASIAAELGPVLGRLVRRLRAERALGLSHAIVLGRLGRDGPQSVSDLAGAERVRPQSMAQTVSELEAEGLVVRRPDPGDRRRLIVEATAKGEAVLGRERLRREGWLASAIDRDLSSEERAVLARAIELLARLAESGS